MSKRSFARLAALITTSLVLAPLCACTQGTKPGDLVGSYSVHGVLVENSCGTSALPTSSTLDFVVEIRLDSGVAYWMPAKASQASGTLGGSGDFRFTMSETQVVSSNMNNPMTRQLEPGDFANAASNPDFDLKPGVACALTRKQTVQGNLARRIASGMVTTLANAASSGGAGGASAGSHDDLDGEHVIEVDPTTGSDCNVALAALGGTYTALPCEARYLLSGSLDTTGAVKTAAGSGAGGRGGAGGAGGSDPDAGR